MYFIKLFKFCKLIFLYCCVSAAVLFLDSTLILAFFNKYEKFKFTIKQFKKKYIPFFFVLLIFYIFYRKNNFLMIKFNSYSQIPPLYLRQHSSYLKQVKIISFFNYGYIKLCAKFNTYAQKKERWLTLVSLCFY
jgi:hypothetical protein